MASPGTHARIARATRRAKRASIALAGLVLSLGIPPSGSAEKNAGNEEDGIGGLPLSCSLEAVRTDGSTALDARVRGAPGMAGTYRLEVRKSDTAGSSSVRQSGDFQIDSAGAARFGNIALSLQEGGRIDAELTLQAGERSARCILQIEAEGNDDL